jgi:SOS-response transcriptional repressor LexA
MAKKYPKLSTILKRLLFERDMKPVDLARELDIPQPTIHRLVVGKSTRPYKSSLEPIAKYFDISVDQLLGEEPLLADWQPEEKLPKKTDAIKTVPMIPWANILNRTNIVSKIKKHVAITGNISNECFGVFMNDHSMEPLFSKGTILIFDPKKSPKDRSFVLAKLKGKEEPIFRQLLIDVEERYLKPLNPDSNIYKIRQLNEEDEIIAILFESRNNFSEEDETFLLEAGHELKNKD